MARTFGTRFRGFFMAYAEERNKARENLGNLFNDADYPVLDSLDGRFSFAIHSEPMPDAQAFDVRGLDVG